MSEKVGAEHRDRVRDVVLSALQHQYGVDNASWFEDDHYQLGVCFPDGDFVTLYVAAERL